MIRTRQVRGGSRFGNIISGSPTGVDRAVLDVALALGLDAAHTRRNVEDADGTLILNLGTLDGGTASTAAHARQRGQPCRVVAREEGIASAAFRDWLNSNRIATLNVAGPRESKWPGVFTRNLVGSWRRCWRRRALNPHPVGPPGPRAGIANRAGRSVQRGFRKVWIGCGAMIPCRGAFFWKI